MTSAEASGMDYRTSTSICRSALVKRKCIQNISYETFYTTSVIPSYRQSMDSWDIL